MNATIDATDTEALVAAIDRRRDDLVALTRDLIRIPTLNPPGEAYLEACEYLQKRLQQRGFQVEMIRAIGALGDSDRYPRWNVIGRREGRHKGSCVHFNSHTDVVATGSGWTFDPFGAEVHDGRIYGRGACDMKGGLAASIIAVEAFLEFCPDYPGAIEISGTADEESGGYGGVAFLAEKGFFGPPRVDHVIIPEPLNKDRICLGHRGVWWAEIETHGRIAHGSMPFLGDCAVRHMGAVMQSFEDHLYPALARRTTPMPIVPDGARQSTLNINSVHGGLDAGHNGFPSACVPDSCRMVIDRRFLIEEDLGEVKSEVAALLDDIGKRRDGFSYDIRDIFTVPPTLTEKSSPVVQSVAGAIQQVLGKPAEFVISPGTYDQKHIDRIGKLKDCIAYGPGILDLAHQPNEYVGIDDMVDSAKVMAIALNDLLFGAQAI